MEPQTNPITNAINALHSAFLPSELGTPESFGEVQATAREEKILASRKHTTVRGFNQNDPCGSSGENGPAPVQEIATGYAKPQSLLEAVVESVAFYTEEGPVLSSLVTGRLSGFHRLSRENAAALLLEAIEERLVAKESSKVSLREKGAKIAKERGWSEPVREESLGFDPSTVRVITEGPKSGMVVKAQEKEETLSSERARVLLDTSAKQLLAFIADHDDSLDLITLQQAERSGKARKTVLAALDARIQSFLGSEALQHAQAPREPITLSNVVTVHAVQGDAERALRAVPVIVPTEPEPVPTLDGQPVLIPRIPRYNPDSSEAAVIGYLLAEVSALRGLVAAQGAEIASLRSAKPAPVAPKPSAPKVVREPSPKVDGEQVEIGTVEPGTFLQPARGSMRLLVYRNGSARIAYFGGTGPRRGFAPLSWAGAIVTPSQEERTALYSVLTLEEKSSLGV